MRTFKVPSATPGNIHNTCLGDIGLVHLDCKKIIKWVVDKQQKLILQHGGWAAQEESQANPTATEGGPAFWDVSGTHLAVSHYGGRGRAALGESFIRVLIPLMWFSLHD